MNDPPRAPAVLLVELHRLVDEASTDLAAKHGERLRCAPGCAECCVDDISVFEVEAQRIRDRCADLLRASSPHPVGACAFLDDDGACRVYEHRPYVCRTQGLPLRWIDEIEPGELAELRDICPVNDPGEPPVEELDEDLCWTLGPFEERLAGLQAAAGGGQMTRVPLRNLFED